MAQVAVSLVLLIGAGLLVTSFAKLRSQPTGFDSSNIFVAGVGLPPSRYPDIDSQSRFWLRLGEALAAAPGASARHAGFDAAAQRRLHARRRTRSPKVPCRRSTSVRSASPSR